MNIELLKKTDESPWTLTSRIGEMLELAEKQFGKINSEFFFLGIEFKDDGPRIQYQDPNKIIIQLTPNSLDNEYMAYYQLSHEVYHLLSPTGKLDANNLEEGLATYFSKLYLDRFPQNNFDWQKSTEEDKRYLKAYQLVDTLLKIDSEVIKKIRFKYPEIKTSYLKLQQFEEVMGDKMPKDIIEELLKPFPKSPDDSDMFRELEYVLEQIENQMARICPHNG